MPTKKKDDPEPSLREKVAAADNAFGQIAAIVDHLDPPAAAASSYDDQLKDDLVAEAESRGLDSSGTKAELVARLEEDDSK